MSEPSNYLATLVNTVISDLAELNNAGLSVAQFWSAFQYRAGNPMLWESWADGIERALIGVFEYHPTTTKREEETPSFASLDQQSMTRIAHAVSSLAAKRPDLFLKQEVSAAKAAVSQRQLLKMQLNAYSNAKHTVPAF